MMEVLMWLQVCAFFCGFGVFIGLRKNEYRVDDLTAERDRLKAQVDDALNFIAHIALQEYGPDDADRYLQHIDEDITVEEWKL